MSTPEGATASTATVPLARPEESAVTHAMAAQARFALSSASNIDDWTSRPSPEHPRPVVLVHGTFANADDNWITIAPALAAAGYCVFRLDYGALPEIPFLHGVGPIEKSAQQLSDFVDEILASTGADKVDIVGHSQGGMMPRYYLKFLGGAAKVNQLIGIAPSNHGTTLDGLTNLAKTIPGAEALLEFGLPAIVDQVAGSDFLTKLNNGGDTVPGVRYTVIETQFDEVVTPFTSAWLDESSGEVTNILLQDLDPDDRSGHVGIVFDPVVLREVLTLL